jgi:hypothetical protein
MKNPDAVRKPAMGGTREHEFREAKLFNSAKALKFSRIQHVPRHLIEIASIEFD